ncbi:ABC transporter permease [Pseudomonas matsuisoli]|uniref:ABC transporter permease n=1 Tax=Pseudomonas matsuisoli TaxID=1515666 RepID=A0A917Q261_9PSED|nr:ABC transporter permease [Pseudomonas matsuisoli]GGK07152.1 ABC transporter permease [Pseudomonas matsuisoli]
MKSRSWQSADVYWGVAGAVLLVVLWEGAVRAFDLPAYILPGILEILVSMVDLQSTLMDATWMTVMEAVSGYVIGSACGILLAVILTLIPTLKRWCLPAAIAINSVPVVAYAPLVLLWFGMGAESKIVMVSLAVGFTVFLSALTGLDQANRKSIDLLRSFGANPLMIIWRLKLPAALPLIASAMRVSTTRSMIVAIVTEMLGAYGGLGWVIYQATLQIDFVQVWAAIFAASLVSLIFFGAVSMIERKVIFWR